MPEVMERDDLDAIDRRHVASLSDFLVAGSAREALSERLTELMTFFRYAPVSDDVDLAALMERLKNSVEFQVQFRADHAQLDRPPQRFN